jgi:hypothetical protein
MLTGTKALCEEIDLVHNPFLRTISFEELSIYSFDKVIKILSRMTSSVIENVMLHIFYSVNTPSAIAALKLPELVALFTGANSVFLERSTTLRFRIKNDDAVGRTAIREGLCELDTQGRLEFI